MVAPRRNSKSGYLNIHIDEADRYRCDIRVQKRGQPYVRRVRSFDYLSCAVEFRDEIREKLGLPRAEDES